MSMSKKEERQTLVLMEKLSLLFDGHSNKVIMNALLSLATQIIDTNNESLPDAMLAAMVSGVQMAENVRRVRGKVTP